MLLKIMGAESGFDTDAEKSFRIISDINEVMYYINKKTGETMLVVYYSQPNRSSNRETFVLQHNAYLMSDDGKTIQVFTPPSVSK